MKRYSYREQDYRFGQAMLRLRMSIGLTQAGLAQFLGVSRRAVGEWEAGSTYPKAEHLQPFLELCVRAAAFPPGREAEEIRTLWQAAHQKLLLDESWLAALLNQPSPPPAAVPLSEAGGAAVLSVPPAASSLTPPSQPAESPWPGGGSALAARSPRMDWGEALDVPSFYGRQEELARLSQWIGEERCREVSVLGIGGIGKSALVVTVMHRVASQFEVVIWRSLRDAPACEALLEECLQVLAPQPLRESADSLEERLRRLLEQLRARRVLLVLDNLEVLLEEGESTGRMRVGFEGYADLLRRTGETAHQSCLLLTSREKPAELVHLEGRRSPVRALRLAGLDSQAGAQLLAEQEVMGSPRDRELLVERYRGNALALKIVAQTIVELFGGEIAPFLEQGEVVFGGVRELLSEQFDRLSAAEQRVLFWLAILREPGTLEQLLAAESTPMAAAQVLEALEGLRRRSLIERGQRPGTFTLQSVVLEYVSERLVEEASQEIVQGRLALLLSHGLSQAQARDYVRQTQERLLLTPLLVRVQSTLQGQGEVEQRLRELLDEIRTWTEDRQGYGPANLVALLRLLRGDLRGLDLSRLLLRGVYLQGVELQDATLSGALLQECVWTQSFDAITALAISKSGQYWAAAGRRGEVRVWRVEREEGQRLHRVWGAHTDTVWALAFSPDERLLASGSADGSLKLWDVESGTARWSGWLTKPIICLAFAPEGDVLASGGNDATLRFWDPQEGTLLEEVPHPASVYSLAWHPVWGTGNQDGLLLASGDGAGTLRLWALPPRGPATCVEMLSGHSSLVHGLTFAPDGDHLASASWDGTVKLWEREEVGRLGMRQTLEDHTERVQCVAWSPDGGTLASGSFDHTIRLRDGKAGSARAVLQGHRAVVHGLAFLPDSRQLLSGSDDGTLRLWDVERGESLRVLEGYETVLFDLDWSPDGPSSSPRRGSWLASAGSDGVVSLWEGDGRGVATPRGRLSGHAWNVYGVAWRPDGGVLASAGWDNALRLWDPATGRCLQVIRDLEHPDTLFFGLAWSPDGKLLASAAMNRGLLLWEGATGSGRWIGRELPRWIRRVAFSPDGSRLVGGGDDGHVYVWDVADGRLLERLEGHDGAVRSVAWSPDGSRLASAGGSKLVVWQLHSGAGVQDLVEHPGIASAVTWEPGGAQLLSGGSDGRVRWWDLRSGQCVRVRAAHQGTVYALKVSPDGTRLTSCGDDGAITLWDLERGEHLRTLRRDRPYERLNITGIRGLSDAQKASLRALGAFEETSAGG